MQLGSTMRGMRTGQGTDGEEKKTILKADPPAHEEVAALRAAVTLRQSMDTELRCGPLQILPPAYPH